MDRIPSYQQINYMILKNSNVSKAFTWSIFFYTRHFKTHVVTNNLHTSPVLIQFLFSFVNNHAMVFLCVPNILYAYAISKKISDDIQVSGSRIHSNIGTRDNFPPLMHIMITSEETRSSNIDTLSSLLIHKRKLDSNQKIILQNYNHNTKQNYEWYKIYKSFWIEYEI